MAKSLIKRAFRSWKRLASHWGEYLLTAGLDLTNTTQETFADDLMRQVHVNSRLRGLEDFCRSGSRGIEPGDPARSLLYHVVASPGVTPEGIDDSAYPAPDDIQTIENLVYGICPPSLEDLRLRADGGPLAIVVFAYEYAPAVDTVHKCHADLCFSRTGISRLGDSKPQYMPKARGYLPFSSANEKLVHAVPCRFGAFIATTKKGDPRTIGPERFQDGDQARDFWIPLHKLFDGADCIDGLDIRLEFKAHHVNQKIRRIHLALEREGFPTPWPPTALNNFPFQITQGIAELGRNLDSGLLTPVPHRLVDVAKTRAGKIVYFPMPENHAVAEAALWFQDQQQARPSPELVHVKHELVRGRPVPLRKRKGKTIGDVVQAGGYKAVNFVDYTGDGWVEAKCRALAVSVPRRLAAYSIVAQPDFFPLVKQKDLMEWWENSAPAEIKDNLWPYQNAPFPLNDERTPVNITLTGAGFDSTDRTMTAIVGLPRPRGTPGRIRPTLVARESALAFRSTGLFFPGWDCSKDFNRDDRSPNGVLHLAHYGLGSPFAEDTMICAAHGSFWPAASPDTTRFFAPGRYPSVTPIFDSDAGWDGVPLPKRRDKHLEYKTLVYTDYVQLAFEGKLKYGHFAQVDLNQYVVRTLSLARVFQVLGADAAARVRWSIVEFRSATPQEIESVAPHQKVFDPACTFTMRMAMITAATASVPGHFELTLATPAKHEFFVACPSAVARRVPGNGGWDVREF